MSCAGAILRIERIVELIVDLIDKAAGTGGKGPE